MKFYQRVWAFFGASYVMHQNKKYSYLVARVYFRAGLYWYKDSTGLTPMRKEDMAKDIHTLISYKANPNSGGMDTKNEWTPLTKHMRAFYVMLPDDNDGAAT